MRAFLILACVLLLPRLVHAQSLPITIGGGVLVNGVTRIGPAHCNSSLTIQWGIPTPAVIPQRECTTPTFWITSGTCGDAPASGDLPLVPVTPISLTDTSGSFIPVPVTSLPLQTADGGGGCGSISTNVTLYVCAFVKYNPNTFVGCGTNDSILRATNSPTIQYRGALPPTPSLDSVAPQDAALVANVSASSDANLVHIELRPLGQGDFAEVATFTPDKTSVRITGLTNGTTYEVRAFVDDGVGNNSPPSATLTATPVASDGLFQTYRRDGGTETGGCGSALPAGLGVPLVLGGYRWLRRKRK